MGQKRSQDWILSPWLPRIKFGSPQLFPSLQALLRRVVKGILLRFDASKRIFFKIELQLQHVTPCYQRFSCFGPFFHQEAQINLWGDIFIVHIGHRGLCLRIFLRRLHGNSLFSAENRRRFVLSHWAEPEMAPWPLIKKGSGVTNPSPPPKTIVVSSRDQRSCKSLNIQNI